MIPRSNFLMGSTALALSLLLMGCGGGSGGGENSTPQTPPVVVNTPPVLKVTVSAETIDEGTWVEFLAEASDDTSVFDPHQLGSVVPEGFLTDGSDPALSWYRRYFAEAVDIDTPTEFSFSITDDDDLTTTVTLDLVVRNVVKEPSDVTVFQSESGAVLGQGAAGHVRSRGSADGFESLILSKIDSSVLSEAYLSKSALLAGGELGTGASAYVGAGTQVWGGAIETLKYGETHQDVYLMADFTPHPQRRLGFKTGLLETSDEGFVELQSFEDIIPTPCAMKKGKIETSTAVYNDVVIGLEDGGIRLFTNDGNLGTPVNAGLLTSKISTHIVNTGSFCDVSLFGDPVRRISSIDFDTGFIHIWENLFGSFNALDLTNINLPAGEAILGYDAVANGEGDLVHAIISSTGELVDDTQRLTIIVTDDATGTEMLRWDRTWTDGQPTSVFVGDLSLPLAETSDKIDVLMALPKGSHAGVIRDERTDTQDFSELNYGELSFAPIAINVHDLFPTESPNNVNGGFLALSSASRGPFYGPILLYDVPQE